MDDRFCSIAILESDVSTIHALRTIFELQNWTVRSFSKGASFLQASPDHLFNCLVMNPDLPDMNAEEVLRQLRSSSLSIPVIVITALPYSPDVVALAEFELHDLLVKPVPEPVLVDSVRTALSAVVLH